MLYDRWFYIIYSILYSHTKGVIALLCNLLRQV